MSWCIRCSDGTNDVLKGMDPTAVPTFVQHVAAFKHNLEHVRELVASSDRTFRGAGDSSAASGASLATASAAAEEHCFRAVVDLREAARQLNSHNWESNIAVLAKAAEGDRALFVPSQKPLTMTTCARGDSAMSWCIRCSDSALRSQTMSPMTSSPLQSLKRSGA